MRLENLAAVVNTYQETSVNTPNLSEMGIVMEILKIFVLHEGLTSGTIGNFDFAIYDRSRDAVPNMAQSGVLYSEHVEFYFNGVNILNYKEGLKVYDYTDSDGKGVLFGKKEIFCSFNSVTITELQNHSVAILYRLVPVSPAEIVGLLSD